MIYRSELLRPSIARVSEQLDPRFDDDDDDERMNFNVA